MPRRNEYTTESLLDRAVPEPMSGCYLWLGAVTKGGYAAVGDGCADYYGHRLSWILTNGPIPEGKCVCHKCDVRSCINPQHLFLGTHGDNARDRERKQRGRQAGGENHGKAQLTEQDVREIRRSVASGASIKEMVARFGTCDRNIRNVVARRIWKKVTETL